MPKITELDLKKQIKDEKLGRLYFIFGEDNFLKHSYANKLPNLVVGDVLPELNFPKINGKSATIQQIADEVDQLPVMAEKRCVLVKDLDLNSKGKNEIEDLKEVLSNVPDTTMLILLFDTIEIDKKKGNTSIIMRACEKHGNVLECSYKTDAEIVKYITVWANKNKVRIDNSVARYLIETCGKDLQKLKGEVTKLCSYKKESFVTKEDVDKLSAKTAEATQYMLPKSILSENIGNSLNILSDLIDMRMKSIQIVNSIASSFIDIYRVKTALDSGKNPTDIADDFGYSKNRLFVLTNSSYTAKKLSFTVLRRCLDIISDTDEKLKSSVTNERLLLEKTIILLIETMRGYNYQEVKEL